MHEFRYKVQASVVISAIEAPEALVLKFLVGKEGSGPNAIGTGDVASKCTDCRLYCRAAGAHKVVAIVAVNVLNLLLVGGGLTRGSCMRAKGCNAQWVSGAKGA